MTTKTKKMVKITAIVLAAAVYTTDECGGIIAVIGEDKGDITLLSDIH